MKLPVKRIHHAAVMPAFQTDGAACFDLQGVSREIKGNTAIYGTGLAFDIPDGYMLEVYSRSGHGFKHDLCLANSVGVIDSDYTGELKIKLTYSGPSYARPEWPYKDDRIAQARLVRTVKTDIVEVDTLKETKRGENGFGSTDEQ